MSTFAANVTINFYCQFIIHHKLTKSLGADMLVFELVIGCIGVDHNPLHAVTAELLLSLKHQRQIQYNHNSKPK